MNILGAFIHHLGAFALVSSLVAQHLLVKPSMDTAKLALLRRLDMIYGISAVTIFIIGFGRATAWEKGWQYYKVSSPFHTKLTLFLLMGLASLYPTFAFIRWRKASAGSPDSTTMEVPRGEYRKVMMSIRFELLAVVGIILCGVLMAKGVGLFRQP